MGIKRVRSGQCGPSSLDGCPFGVKKNGSGRINYRKAKEKRFGADKVTEKRLGKEEFEESLKN
jgi:hypothetical protein